MHIYHVLPPFLCLWICKQCVPGSLFLCQHNSLGPKLINGKIDLQLFHKVEKTLRSHLVVEMRILSMSSTNFLKYTCHTSRPMMESLKNLGGYVYMYHSYPNGLRCNLSAQINFCWVESTMLVISIFKAPFSDQQWYYSAWCQQLNRCNCTDGALLSTMVILFYTWLYNTLPWLYFTLLYFTLLNSTTEGFDPGFETSLRQDLTLLPSTIPLFHSTSLHITAPWLYFILLHSTWLYITLPWLYYTQFDSKLLFTLFHSTGFYHGSTSLYLTLPLLYITLPLFY